MSVGFSSFKHSRTTLTALKSNTLQVAVGEEVGDVEGEVVGDEDGLLVGESVAMLQ